MSLPTYSNARGIAERRIRSTDVTMVIQWLVCQTNLKKAGRLRNAAKRSFKVSGSIRVFLGGRIFNGWSFFLSTQVKLGVLRCYFYQ